MTVGEMLGQSGILTIMGMGTVFLFLIILVFCVTLMGKFFQNMQKNNPVPVAASQPAPVKKAPPPSQAPVVQANNQGDVTAAISAAVTLYRQDHE
jgi:oxaloacetate decarboxylase gamma subunit